MRRLSGGPAAAGEHGRRAVRRGSGALLVATLIAAVLFATGTGALPHRGATSVVYDLVLFNLVYLGAAALSWRAARRVPAERPAWVAATATWLLSAVGNLLYPLTFVPGGSNPFPSPADVCWLSTYPLIAFAAISLVQTRNARFGPAAWLDAAIGALGVTACATSLLLLPALEGTGLEVSPATLLYPVSDVLLVALMGAVVALDGVRRDPVLQMSAVAIVGKLIGDVALTRGQALGGYEVGGPLDLTYVVAGVLAAAAAASAADRRRPAPREPRGPRTRWSHLALPMGCTVVSLLVLGAQWQHGALDVGGACALACVLSALVRTGVTAREMRALQDVRRQAETDELTGLANRRALMTAGERLIAAGSLTVIVLDLDGFKAVNDGMGHHAGDELLRVLAERIRRTLRPGDVLARHGGDEFALLLPTSDRVDAETCADRLHRLVSEPVVLREGVAHVGASIGLATAPDDADTVDGLLRAADTAMYAAKHARGGVRSWSAGLADTALAAPVAAPADAEVCVRRLVSPDGRVALDVASSPDGRPLALAPEQVHRVLAVLSARREGDAVPVEILLGAGCAAGARVADRIAAAALRAGLAHEHLVVRLGAEAIAAAPHAIAALIADLRTRGIRTAVDGGVAAALGLSGLHRWPPDWLHLDRAVVADALTQPRGQLVLAHTVALARTLDVDVLVEQPTLGWAAADLLHRMGCTVLLPDAVVDVAAPSGAGCPG